MKQNKIKVLCVCGSEVYHLKLHEKSNKHKMIMEFKNSNPYEENETNST